MVGFLRKNSLTYLLTLYVLSCYTQQHKSFLLMKKAFFFLWCHQTNFFPRLVHLFCFVWTTSSFHYYHPYEYLYDVWIVLGRRVVNWVSVLAYYVILRWKIWCPLEKWGKLFVCHTHSFNFTWSLMDVEKVVWPLYYSEYTIYSDSLNYMIILTTQMHTHL